jgi:SNF2 family DNA or RNA helicase
MRRAAYPDGHTGSAKLIRLREIVVESMEDGFKVIVFSEFLRVTALTATVLDEFPQIVMDGATPVNQRQKMIDRFTEHDGPMVLIGQIEVLGEIFNIQAASVVIIAEPQLKPSRKEQAIHRAYRMGQPRMVHVYRLLAKDYVDERLEDILSDKRKLFRAYAHESEAKRSHASATDPRLVDYELSTVDQQRIIDAETERLRLSEQFQTERRASGDT